MTEDIDLDAWLAYVAADSTVYGEYEDDPEEAAERSAITEAIFQEYIQSRGGDI